MKRILIVFAAAVIIAAAAHSPSAHAAGILIDDFTVAQGPFTTSSLISPDGGTLDTLSVLGGERDMGVGMEDLGGGSVTAEVTGGSLNYTQTGTITGGVGVSWDGDDNAWFPPDDAIDRDGLGGLDLTAGGIDAFCVTVEPSGPYDIAIGVTSDDASGSQFLVDLPAITETTVIKFPFADFSANDGEDPADFTNIGSINLAMAAGGGSTTGVVSRIETCLAAELLINPAFDAGDTLTSWNAINASLFSSGQAFSAPNLILFSGQGGQAVVRQTVTVSGFAGDPFTLTYAMGGQNIPAGTLNGARLTFFDGGSQQKINCLANNTGSFNWQQQTCTVTAPTAYDSVLVEIGWVGADSGLMGIDSASLTR